jgi:hypothetical protein
MSAMREELHHSVDLLPEAGLRRAPGLIRAHAAGDHGPEADLPFVASSEALHVLLHASLDPLFGTNPPAKYNQP